MPKQKPLIPRIMEAIDDLVESEDDTGCDGGLTVVDQAPVIALRDIYKEWRESQT